MEVKAKFNYINLLLILVFVVGLGILLYPNISDYFNQKNSSKYISEYDDTISQLNAEERAETAESARTYNQGLLDNPMGRFADMTEAMFREYMAQLNIGGDGMMCYLKIDKLGVNLPVYHTTDEAVLQKYVGHIEGTSLPVGGPSTHCGLSGHRGLPSAVLFTNLDRMEVGDVFSVLVLGEEHIYQVDQISVVLPNDVSPLAIVPDMDYCTLVTCTPYGENTHRLMVRGVRVQDDAVENIIPHEDVEQHGMTREQIVNIIAGVMAGIFLFGVLPLILFPVVPKHVIYLRPWDDHIEEVFQAAIQVSESATRANWEMDDITSKSDRMAKMRRWNNRLTQKEGDGSVDYWGEELREWEDYDYEEARSREEEEKEEDLREWDDEILEKVDQDWSVFDREAHKAALIYKDVDDAIRRGTPVEPPQDLKIFFHREMNIGEWLRKRSKRGPEDL